MEKKILVTGGAGLIGSHLCARLLDEGNEVICLDNFFTGNKLNIINLLDNRYFEVIRHDVCNPIKLEVDEIYNLACPASPLYYQIDPIQTTKTSVMGAINVLDMAKRLGIKVLQASTSEIYGDPQVHPQKENYWGNVNPIGVRACYDEGKRCAETLFFNYQKQSSVKIKIIRIFNTYGPNMSPDDGRVVSNFIVQALADVDVAIFGDGTQTRSFYYVDDMVKGIIRMMDADESFTGPVNLGNPEEYNIKEIAEKIIDITGSKSKLIYKPLPEDDPKKRKPDISLAKKELDWKSTTSLDEGLKKTIEYFDNILNKRNI